MKKSTIKTINTNLNNSLQKAQEATAILRACVQLAINEDSKLTYVTLCESIPMFSKFSAKTLKNCIRFAKTVTKNTKKRGIKALIEFYKQDDIRKAYDVLVNPNRHQEAGKTEAGKTEAGKTEAGKTEAGKTESGKTESGKTESGKTEASKVNLALSNHFSESNKHKQKNDIELFVDSLSLEELKQAYTFIRNRLGIKASEKTLKMINDIKQVAY